MTMDDNELIKNLMDAEKDRRRELTKYQEQPDYIKKVIDDTVAGLTLDERDIPVLMLMARADERASHARRMQSRVHENIRKLEIHI